MTPAPTLPTARARVAPAGALAFALALAAAGALSAQVDTVYACPGAAVTLAATPGGEVYSWTGPDGRTRPSASAQTLEVGTRGGGGLYVATSRPPLGRNLVANPGFELGNRDFDSDYAYVPGGTNAQASYAILDDPRRFNVAFASCDGPLDPDGLLFVADGSTVLGQSAWCQDVDGLDPDGTYAFSAYITGLVPPNPSTLAFTVDGALSGPTITASGRPCEWRRFFTVVPAAGRTAVRLCVDNQNTQPNGNDFALDEIALRRVGDLTTDSLFVVRLPVRTATLEVALCSGERYADNGLDLGPDETATALLTGSNGCDSVLTVRTVTSDEVFAEARADTLCPGEVLRYGAWVITTDTVLCERTTSAAGCDSTFCLTVKFLDDAALVADLAAPSCSGGADGSVAVDVQAGRPPFTYAWATRPETAPLLDGLPAGTYQVVVTDSVGCVATATYELTDPEPLRIADLFVLDARCFGESSGLAATQGAGGTPPYTARYEARGRVFDGEALPAGRYEAVLTDAGGCEARQAFEVGEPLQVRVDLTGDREVRLGALARAEAKLFGEAPVAAWSFAGVPIDSLVAGTALTWRPFASGEYRVEARDTNGCAGVGRLALRVTRPELELFPEAFSPNGDGVNDAFGPVPDPAIAGVDAFAVFDRWGGLLWRRGACARAGGAGADCGWDGRAANGARLDAGVYVYRAEVRLLDGTVVEAVGSVTLYGGRDE